MTAAPCTGRTLFHALRRADVVLTANGDRLAFDAPAGGLTADLRGWIKARKSELLALVRGDYLGAAVAMVADEPDADRQQALSDWFDERAAIAEYGGGLDRAKAERFAYIALCRAVEGGDL